MEIYNGSYIVYVHTNMINGKAYVGITKQLPKNRFWQNGYKYDSSPRFYNAIQKYGWQNFNHEIFAKNLTFEEAANMEKFLIFKFNLQNDNYGYNIKEGGQGGVIPEETKLKIGLSNKGRKATEETKKILSNAHKGYKHTENERKNISRANRGKNKPKEWTEKRKGMKYNRKSEKSFVGRPATKKVICVETGCIYETVTKAAQAYNVSVSSMSDYCNHKRMYEAGELHFEFVL